MPSLSFASTRLATARQKTPACQANVPQEIKDEIAAVLYDLQRQHETAPTLQSTDNASLFAKQIYRPGAQTALVDMKGHKNMIVIFEADPAAAGYGRGSTFVTDTPVPATFRALDFRTPLVLTYTWYRLTAFSPAREGPEIRGTVDATGFVLDQPLAGLGSATAAPNEWIDYQGIDSVTTTAKHIRVNVRDTLPPLTSRAVGGSNDALYTNYRARVQHSATSPRVQDPRQGQYAYVNYRIGYTVRLQASLYRAVGGARGSWQLIQIKEGTRDGDSDEPIELVLEGLNQTARYYAIDLHWYITPKVLSHNDDFAPVSFNLATTTQNPNTLETATRNVRVRRAAGTNISHRAYDGNVSGGTAELSFEVADGGDPAGWKEYVSAAEVGAITNGQRLAVSFGADRSNKVLPSVQSGFRARLNVKSAAINTGVRLLRVP